MGSTHNKRSDVKLLNDHTTRHAYVIPVGGRFAHLLEEATDEATVNDTWNSIYSGFQDTSAEVLGTTKSRRAKDWLSIEMRQLAKERRELKVCKIHSPQSTTQYNYLCPL